MVDTGLYYISFHLDNEYLLQYVYFYFATRQKYIFMPYIIIDNYLMSCSDVNDQSYQYFIKKKKKKKNIKIN